MSLFRRQTRAAGYSWRKWEDPIVYRRPWLYDVLFWALCVTLGAVVGAVAVAS